MPPLQTAIAQVTCLQSELVTLRAELAEMNTRLQTSMAKVDTRDMGTLTTLTSTELSGLECRIA